MEFYTYILPNGMRCILKRTKSAVVHCAISVNTGSRDELPGEYGIAHLAEHTFFKGTGRRKAYQVNCRLENLGGELNAFTSKEETVIHATTLRGDYAKAVELLADIVFNSTFPEKEVEKEKRVIFDEINLYKDSPTDRIYDEFEDLIFAGSSLGHNILGRKSTLNKLHSKDIRAFIGRTYTPDQIVFSMIGNVSEKIFNAAMLRHFGDVPAQTRGFSREMSLSPAQFDRSVGRGTHQAHCIVGGRAYNLNDPRRLPLMLLMNALGGPSANSLLNILLREKNALSYTVEASYTPFSDTGMAAVYFSTDKENTEQCMELISGLLDNLKTNSLTPRQLSIAKKQFLGQFAITAESNEGYMLAAAKSYLVFNEIDSIGDIRSKVNEITREDICGVAGDIFNNLSTLTYK